MTMRGVGTGHIIRRGTEAGTIRGITITDGITTTIRTTGIITITTIPTDTGTATRTAPM